MSESEKEDLESELQELREENERLSSENEEMREVFAEALADSSPFSAESIASNFTFEEIADGFEESPAEALSPAPRTGGADGGPQDLGSSDGSEAGVEALSAPDEDIAEARALQDDVEMLGAGAPEALKDDIADLVGVESYDEATEIL